MLRPAFFLLICATCPMLYNFYTSVALSTMNSSLLLPSNAKSTPIRPLQEKLLSREERHVPLAQSENEAPAGTATTLAFIEVIVKRTVDQYMKVIRTQSDWFERLLQLVREELNIRSKYNCSTDACIYKIQLFTHYLHSHLNGARARLKFPHRGKRVRRSVDESIDNIEVADEAVNLDDMPQPQLEKSKLEIIPNEQVASTYSSSQPSSAPLIVTPDKLYPVETIEDDALRLPEIIPSANSQNQSAARDVMVENDSSQTQVSHFGTPDKINMVRVSQEVLSEALFKKQRAASHSISNGEEIAIRNENPTSDKQATESNAIEKYMNNYDPNSDPSEQQSSEPDQEISESQTVETEIAKVPESHASENPTTTSRLSTKPGSNHSPVSEKETRKHRNSNWKVDNPVADRRPQPLQLDLSLPAIPFGQNEFVGKPYENCTGRFESYCYNALKCVYISVLETAACYCRTGYTGVRCDMFNLPQTLDILRSFKEEIVDVPSLHQTNAVTLYSVVEATARYTVNAVLEENLLSTWEEESIY